MNRYRQLSGCAPAFPARSPAGTRRVGCLVCTLLILAASAFAAEKPAIDRLFPPGGQRGTDVDVSLNGKSGDGALQVASEFGQLTFSVTEKADSMTVTISENAVPGVHWIRFHNQSGSAQPLPFVVGVLPELRESEPNNRITEATPLNMPSAVVNGVLDKNGDVDVFRVEATAGQTLVAAVQAHEVLGSPMDAVLQVLDERGTILAHNDDDHGNDPLIALTVPSDGAYFVRIFAFPAAPNSSIQFAGAATYIYRLTITTDPVASYTLPLAVQEGSSATLSIHGWNLPEEMATIQLDVPEPASDSTSGRIMVTDSTAYPLAVDCIPFPSFRVSDLSDGSSDLVPPFAISGTIDEPRQRDGFWFSGSKDQKLRCEAVARARFSQLDPILTVLAEDGRVLKEVDDISRDNADALLDVTLPADGRYRIEVRDRFNHAGERYFYLLRCADITPDATLSVKDHQFVMEPDKPLEIAVSMERKDGFSLPLHVDISGLPAGITCETVVSPPEGDASKAVTLTLAGSTPEGFAGPIRINARTTVDQTVVDEEAASDPNAESPATPMWQRTAEFTLGPPGTRSSWLWLTIPAAPATDEKSDCDDATSPEPQAKQ